MAFSLGDKVIINPESDEDRRYAGVVFEITKVPTRRGEVNYTMRPANPNQNGGNGLRAREAYLLPADAAPSGVQEAAAVADVPMPGPFLWPGTVVRMRGVEGLHVVIAGKSAFEGDGQRDNTYRVFPLGGSDRYRRNVPQRHLTVVDPATIVVVQDES